MSICNYCILKRIKLRAKQEGKKVTILNEKEMSTWKSIYVHPKDVIIKNFPGGMDGKRAEYREALFMALSDHCVC